MTIFTVHVPRDPVAPRIFAERVEVIPDAFSWGAFVFGPLWLGWNRLWFGLTLWFLAIALIWLLGIGRLPFAVLLGLGLLLESLLGLEANGMLASALRKRGLVLTQVVAAGDADASERRFFQGSALGRPEDAPAPKSAPPGPSPQGEFVGLFPDGGG